MRFRILSVAFAVVALLAPSAAEAITFADIEFWTGSGANESVLILDWNNSANSLAWGYRWDAGASAQDVLYAIAGTTEARDPIDPAVILETLPGADPRLGLEVLRYNFGDSLYGMGYDLDDDGGFSYVYEVGEAGHAADPDDIYIEGWNFAGFMHMAIGTGPESESATWESALLGMADTLLEDGKWYGFTWDEGYTFEAFPAGATPAPAPASAIPEPASLALLLAGTALAWRRRRA